MIDFQIELPDLQKLDYDLAEMPKVVASKIYRNALNKGADIILEAIKASAPVSEGEITLKSTGLTPGELRDGIIKKLKIDVANNIAEAQIRPSKTVAHVARWMEFGWMLTKGKKNSPKRKKIRQIPPHPFIRPAYDANLERAMDAIREELLNGIAQYWTGSSVN